MQPDTSTTYLKQGQHLQRQGLLTEAEVAYRQAIELNPIFYGSFRYLGEVLALEGKLDQAVEAYQRAKELNPKALWVHQGLGEVFLQLNKIEDAIACFQTAIQINSDFSWAYNGLGDCWSLKGNRENAIAAYQKAVELNPDSETFRHNLEKVLAERELVSEEEIIDNVEDSLELEKTPIKQKTIEEAIASYRRIIELNPDNVEAYHNLLQVQPDNSEIWLQLAQVFVRQEQIEDAIAAYHRAIELNPKSLLSHQQLGKVLANQGDVAGAIASYRRAIELNPNSVEVVHDLWAALKIQIQWEQAVEIYSQILVASPDFGFAHYYLGAALACLCRWEEAATSYHRAIELNLDYSFWPHQLLGSALAKQGKLNEAIASYEKALEIQPNWRGYFELGLVFVEQNRLDEALLCYQNAVEIEPNQAQSYSSLQELLTRAYHQLGINQAEQGLLEEAIASYLESVKLSPEKFDYCHRLGELLARVNQPQQWEKVIALYQSIITQRSDLVWAHHFWGDALRNTQEWEAACQAYRNAISLKPDFFWSYLFLGDCAKELQQWEEVITAHQRAVELRPETTHLNNNIGEAYYQLGKKYIEQNQLEKAVQCYQKALEKQHYQKQAYYDLREGIARYYHQLGIHQAEQGLLDEAIVCFQKATTIDSTQGEGEVYEYLWKGLNQQGVLDETSRYCQNDIQREAVEAYFSNTCTYKIINWWELNTDDKEYIKKAGLSLVKIDFSIRDQRSLEKIYMKSFGMSPIEESAKKETKNGRIFQQSIVETSYIYTVCPFNGKILRSNQSFVIGGIWPTPVHVYRFVGREMFYLLVGDWIGDKMYIYIPSIELIIQLRHLVSNLQGAPLFNKFKGYLVSEWKEVISYLSNPQKEVAAILGFFSNIGHYTWNDLTGIQYLHERGLLNNIDKFIVGSMEYFNISDIWQENIPPNKRIQVKDPQNLFKTVLINNCFTFRITDLLIKEDLANRISKGSYQRCSQEFLQQIEIAKQNFPLVCFQIRLHIRFWLSQVEGIAKIINELSKDYPNLGVVFDGWSRTEIDSPGDNEMIALENGEVAKIIDRLDARSKIYNAIGCKTYEKVLWAQAVDTYIAPSGSGLTFLSTIANKMGIVHGDSEFFHNRIKLDLSLSRENGIPPLLVPGYNLEGDLTPAVHRNYECDWSAIYDEVIKIIQSCLQPER